MEIPLLKINSKYLCQAKYYLTDCYKRRSDEDDLAPTTIAPGQYGHTVYFDPMEVTYSSDFIIEDLDEDGIWIIAHAVVCWEELE